MGNKGWEEEFENKFVLTIIRQPQWTSKFSQDEVKDFIAEEKSKSYKEGVRDAVREIDKEFDYSKIKDMSETVQLSRGLSVWGWKRFREVLLSKEKGKE